MNCTEHCVINTCFKKAVAYYEYYLSGSRDMNIVVKKVGMGASQTSLQGCQPKQNFIHVQNMRMDNDPIFTLFSIFIFHMSLVSKKNSRSILRAAKGCRLYSTVYCGLKVSFNVLKKIRDEI